MKVETAKKILVILAILIFVFVAVAIGLIIYGSASDTPGASTNGEDFLNGTAMDGLSEEEKDHLQVEAADDDEEYVIRSMNSQELNLLENGNYGEYVDFDEEDTWDLEREGILKYVENDTSETEEEETTEKEEITESNSNN